MKKAFSTPIVYCLMFVAYCFIFPACNPTKKLTEGELLLKKNVVIDKSSGIGKSEIETYIKQKPNKKMLFWRLSLNIYNSVNQEKMEIKKEKRDVWIDSVNAKYIRKINLVNTKRIAEGKQPKKIVLKSKERLTRREWLLSIGEPPVIYDSLLVEKSVKQIKLFVTNKGFFNCVVRDSVQIKNKKAAVYYIVNPRKPYRIRNLSYEIKDDQLHRFVLAEASNTHIKHEKNYDLDLLEKERDLITTLLRNEGYFFFSKDYIYFHVDSSLGTHEVDITLGIKNPIVKVSGSKDSVSEGLHKQYYLGNIFVHTDFDPKLKLVPTDTLLLNNYYMVSTGKLRYKPKLLTGAIFLTKGDLYQQANYELTHKRLSELKMFRSVQLQFIDIGHEQLECHIYLSNLPKQSISVEPDFINTSETYGAGGNITYQNKNIFKGGEIFEVKFKGALEVQKQINGSSTAGSINPFNTRELGGQINLSVPRFLTPFGIQGRKSNNAKTNFTSSYNYQYRPDYERSISNIAYGYSWNETATKKHLINPIDLSFVNDSITNPALRTTIYSGNDLFLKNLYKPHFTIGTRYSFLFTNQNIKKQQNFSYFKFGFEGAGNAMRGIFNLDPTIHPNANNSYLLDGIPFSQFIRADFDYRYYQILTSTDKMVYRIVCGYGDPFQNGNLKVLPLEQSFFAGGPNDIRAWQARTLGPGGYQNNTSVSSTDKIGDVKIEGNIEYRFHIIKMLNAALFLDAGNVWLQKPDNTNYPAGDFQLNFLNQLAVGGGLGLRFDFNFFIIRLDGAVKLRDPALPEGWTYNRHLIPNGVLNFGIGYPF